MGGEVGERGAGDTIVRGRTDRASNQARPQCRREMQLGAHPRTVGRIPAQRDAPAFPRDRLKCSCETGRIWNGAPFTLQQEGT